MKNNKAITLIALVITIIVLLILAGITVAQLSGNNLFENAKFAKEKYQKAREQEDEIIGDYEDAITGDRGNKVNYSTEEQVVGTWIDGKPIYQKVFNNLNLQGTWESQYFACLTIDPLISNVKQFISIKLIGDYLATTTDASIRFNTTNDKWVIKYLENNTYDSIILQYTKTTD